MTRRMPMSEATCERVAPALFFDRFGGGAPLVLELIETSIADVGDVKINLKAYPYISASNIRAPAHIP